MTVSPTPGGGDHTTAESTTNRTLTVVAATLLTLETIGLIVWLGITFLSFTICGMSCEEGWKLFDWVLVAFGIGLAGVVATVVCALVWRRFSCAFLFGGCVVVPVTAIAMSTIGSTPLS